MSITPTLGLHELSPQKPPGVTTIIFCGSVASQLLPGSAALFWLKRWARVVMAAPDPPNPLREVVLCRVPFFPISLLKNLSERDPFL